MNIDDYFKPKPHKPIDALIRELVDKKPLSKSMKYPYVVETDKFTEKEERDRRMLPR